MSIHTDAKMEKTRLKKLITELKKTKRTLDESQRNIFLLADATREGIVIHEKGIIRDANSFFSSLLGFTPAEIIGQPVEKFIAPESHEAFERHNDAESEKPYESIGLRKDGSRIISETFDTTIPFHGRKAQAKVFRDITERRLSEEASRKALEYQVHERTMELKKTVEELKAERQRFIDVLDALPAYVALLDLDYHVPFANRFFRERFGESHGLRCFEFLFGRGEPCEVCETFKVMKTMAPLKWEWTGPDGRNYDISDFPFTGPDGSTFILEMGVDVTERKQTEAKLEEYRTHLEELVKQRTGQLEAANERLRAEIAERRRTEEEIEKLSRFPKENPSPVLRVSSEGTILYANSASSILLESLGIASGDALPEQFREVVIGVMRTGESAKREVGCGDRIVILNIAPIPGADYVNIYGLDITERKQAEEALEEARYALEERVRFRTRELNELNKVLQAEIVTRRIAEEKLRETGEILEKTFSTTHISIAYLEREFTYMRVNRAYAEEYGLDEKSLVGRNHFDLFPDAKNEEIFRKTVETGEPYSAFAQPFENPNLPGRGIIYLDWSLSPVTDHDGSVEGLIYILVNVTERVLSHQRILESEKKFRELADSLPQTIIESDSRGNITFTNRNGLKIFGYTDADVRAGLSIFNMIASEERKSAEKEFAEIMKMGKPFTGEYTARRKDGTTFPIIVYANAILQNSLITGTRAVVINITERKKMEDTIKQNEARLALAQRIAHLGYWDWNICTNELYWSEEVYTIFGLDMEVFIPTYETFLNCIHSEDREKVIKAVDEAIHEKKQYTVEHRVVLPDTTVRVVNEQGEVTYDTDGRAVRMVGTVLDITTLKMLEQKRMEAIQLAERASRLASIGEVAGGITHEINQPLNAIKVTVDGILLWHRNNVGLVPEQFISMLGKISGSIDRISNIIKHMRTFWVTPDNRVEEVFNINEVITQALSLVTRQLSSHGIKIETKLSEPSLYITGNPLHIEQIVINLAHNAMNSLDSVAQKDKMLLVETLRKDDAVQLMVTDNGTGLPEGIGNQLFDPFYSTRQPGEGTGLGLAIVKRFVEEHKGFIRFANNPSGGAIFTINFPISQAARVNNNEHPSR